MRVIVGAMTTLIWVGMSIGMVEGLYTKCPTGQATYVMYAVSALAPFVWGYNAVRVTYDSKYAPAYLCPNILPMKVK